MRCYLANGLIMSGKAVNRSKRLFTGIIFLLTGCAVQSGPVADIPAKPGEISVPARPDSAPKQLADIASTQHANTEKPGNPVKDDAASGVYSEFLHEWAVNVSAVYKRVPSDEGCRPSYTIVYENGHVLGADPAKSCGPDSDRAFLEALEIAPRPPMPKSFANQQITIIFNDTGKD